MRGGGDVASREARDDVQRGVFCTAHGRPSENHFWCLCFTLLTCVMLNLRLIHSVNSLKAMGTFMCPFRIEKTRTLYND